MEEVMVVVVGRKANGLQHQPRSRRQHDSGEGGGRRDSCGWRQTVGTASEVKQQATMLEGKRDGDCWFSLVFGRGVLSRQGCVREEVRAP